MKLTKAIETTQNIPAAGVALLSTTEIAAINLLIEAGKWRLLMEHDYGSWCGPPLPGETK